MLVRERPRASATLPPPAPIPNLRDALSRRASVFGPVEVDEAPPAPAGLSRRSGLFAAAQAIVGALGLAVLPSPTRASLDGETDARLITWCAELAEIDAALSDLFARAPDIVADSHIDVLSTRWSAAAAGIERTTARGQAGLAAKARAVRHLDLVNLDVVGLAIEALAAVPLPPADRLREVAILAIVMHRYEAEHRATGFDDAEIAEGCRALGRLTAGTVRMRFAVEA